MCQILQMPVASPASLKLVTGQRYSSSLHSGIKEGLVFITPGLVKPETCQEFATCFAARDSSASGLLEGK